MVALNNSVRQLQATMTDAVSALKRGATAADVGPSRLHLPLCTAEADEDFVRRLTTEAELADKADLPGSSKLALSPVRSRPNDVIRPFQNPVTMSSFFSSSPFGKFSDVVPSLDNDGYLYDETEGIRRSNHVKSGELRSVLDPRMSTVHEMLMEAVRLSADKHFLGSHSSPSEPYSWLTFRGVYERVCEFASGLLGVCSVKTDGTSFLGIYGRNAQDWIITELACCSYNFVAVPLYDTLGVESLRHICTHAELSVCVCVTVDRARNLLQLQLPLLKHIILIFPDEIDALRAEAGPAVQVHSFDDILNYGKEHRQPPSVS
nr:unnamed protein product [Spirometra erinaceieuropaei]